MKIAIGCDHGGIVLKDSIVNYLKSNNYEIVDYGTLNLNSCDYPDFALGVAEAVASNACSKGILLCGTGIGISIAANKVKGIRAALCHDIFTAEMCSAHNNANIIAMGGRIITPDKAVEIIDKWLNTPFENGRHSNRVAKIMEIENKYFK